MEETGLRRAGWSGRRVGGGASVTVPGIVGAWSSVHERYGRLPLDRILEAAIRLAHRGMPMPASLAVAVENQRSRLERNGAGTWSLLKAAAGELVIQEELGMLLARIGKEGASALYRGACAEAMVAAVKAQGGALDTKDLRTHETVIAEPIAGEIRGMRLLVQPPVSQGVLLAMSAKALLRLATCRRIASTMPQSR